MYCCSNCFSQQDFKTYIEKAGQISDCSYCDSKNVKCIYTQNMYEIFKDIFESYVRIEVKFDELYKKKSNYKQKSCSLLLLMQNDWNIFEFSHVSELLAARIISDITSTNPNIYITPEEVLSNTWVKVTDKYYGYFTIDSWNNFCSFIKHNYRYIHESTDMIEFEPLKIFNRNVFEYVENYIKKGTLLYRARDGYVFDKKSKTITAYPKSKMGVPNDQIISTGRANPPGINYLYAADDVDTTAAEIRSYKSAIISIATIQVTSDLNIVDLTNIHDFRTPLLSHLFNLNDDKMIIDILKAFADDMSKPVNPKSSDVEYIPTQYICELIKLEGFDGLKFKSSLGIGNNVVLFNTKKVKIKDVELYKVKHIEYNCKKYYSDIR